MTRFEWCLIALFIGIIAFQCFVPPEAGLANNGDYGKLIGRFSLVPDDGPSPEGQYYVQRWKYDPAGYWLSDNVSSEILPVRGALAISSVFGSRIFDLRILGVLHAALWIACFAAALPLFRLLPGWTRYAVSIFALFVFTDVSYVAHFNSFYTDTVAFIFLGWCIVISLRIATGAWTGWFPFLGLLASALLVIFSKPQHSPLGLLLWPLAAGASVTLTGRSARFAGLILAPLLPVAAIIGVQLVPEEERQDALFNVIFAKTLEHSTDRAADLRELGLSPDLLLLIGRFAQKDDSPMKDPAFRHAFSVALHHRLGLFLLHHPPIAAGLIYQDLHQPAAQRRPPPIGNYRGNTGFQPYAKARSFGWWSAFRSRLFRSAPWHILIWYAAFAGAAVWGAWRYRGTIAGNVAAVGLVIAALGVLAVVIASFGEVGETDRHLLVFHVLTDMTMALGAAGAAIWSFRPARTLTTMCA